MKHEIPFFRTLRVMRAALIVLVCLLTCCSFSQGDEELEELAVQVNDIFRNTRENGQELALAAAEVLGNPEKYKGGIYPDRRYQYYQNSVYYTPEDDGGCAVWASGIIPVDEALRAKIKTMEHLDKDIKKCASGNQFISQSYVLTNESLGVVFPFYDTVAYMPPLLNFHESILPFYSAKPDANPSRGPVWIEPYIDATGKGYTVSVTCPVYVKDSFEGVAGSDVPLLPVRKALLDSREAGYMILTQGMVLAAINEQCEELTSLKGLEEFYYLEDVKEDVHASEDFKLSNNSDQEILALSKMLEVIKDKGSFDMTIKGKLLHFSAHRLEETGWLLVRVISD